MYTNLPTAGAMRGYGIPQVCFALESHIDDIATKLKDDSYAAKYARAKYSFSKEGEYIYTIPDLLPQ